MKYIVYKSRGFMQVLNADGELVDEEIVGTGRLEHSKENEEYAKSVAIDGEFWIEDDGIEEQPTFEDRIEALETALLEMILGGLA